MDIVHVASVVKNLCVLCGSESLYLVDHRRQRWKEMETKQVLEEEGIASRGTDDLEMMPSASEPGDL